jgi:transcriptional regulator with XRE-family HTH domain
MANTFGASPDPDDSLGAALARLRRARNLTGRQLGKLVNMSQPKISRLENGVGLADPADVELVARALDAPEDLVRHLKDLAEESHNRMTDWRPLAPSLANRQRGVGELEADARVLRIFQPTVIPGLLQTSDYARAVLTPFQALTAPRADAASGVAVPETVSFRVMRQEILADPTRTFHFIITESVLTSQICPPDYMPSQIQHLREVAKQENVTVGVIPKVTRFAIPPIHGFVLAGDSTVMVDLFNTAISSLGSSDAAFYRQVFEVFRQQSSTDIDPILDRHLQQYLNDLLEDQERRT